MAEDRRVDIDVRLKDLNDLKELKKRFEETDGTVLKVTGHVKELRAQLEALSLKAGQRDTSLSAFGGVRGSAALLRSGGVDASLINAGVTGRINRLAAEQNNALAKIVNAVATNNRNVIRAFDARLTNQLVSLNQKPFDKFKPSNIGAAESFVEAARVRAANAALTDAAGSDERTRRNLDTQVRSLQRAKQIRDEMVSAQEKSLSISRQIEGVQARISKADSALAVATKTGIDIRIRDAEISRQKLVIEKELIRNLNGETNQLKIQEALLAKMVLERQAIVNSSRIPRGASPTFFDDKVSNVVGDSGASLFKIQAQLGINFLVINKFFQLINFGKTFVVELDKAFTDLQAITATTNSEMVGLSRSLIKVSENTKFTAVEVAKASIILGQAGFNAQQIAKAIGPITEFATATGATLDQAVTIATSALNIFNLASEETGRVVNIMTAAINLTKLDIEKLSLALQFAGNTAAQTGTSIEELTTLIGLAADSGIRAGSTIGTGLNQLFTAFIDPSEKFVKQLKAVGLSLADIDIQTRGVSAVIKTLDQAGFGASNALQAMDVRAARLFITLKNNIGREEELNQALILTNAAAEANKVQMTSLANINARFASVLGTVIVKLSSPFVAALKAAASGMTSLLSALNNTGSLLPVIGTAVISFGAAWAALKLTSLIGNLVGLGAVLQALGITAARTAVTQTALTATASAAAVAEGAMGAAAAGAALPVTALTTVMGVGLGPILAVTAAIGLAIGAYSLFGNKSESLAVSLDKAKGSLDTSKATFDSLTTSVESVQAKIDELNNRYADLTKDEGALTTETLKTKVQFAELGFELDGTKTGVDSLTSGLNNLIAKLRDLQGIKLASVIEDLKIVVRLQGQQILKDVEESSRNTIDSFREGPRGVPRTRFLRGIGIESQDGFSLGGLSQSNISEIAQLGSAFGDVQRILGAAADADVSTPEGADRRRAAAEASSDKLNKSISILNDFLAKLNSGELAVDVKGLNSEDSKALLSDFVEKAISTARSVRNETLDQQGKFLGLGDASRRAQDNAILSSKEFINAEKEINEAIKAVSIDLSRIRGSISPERSNEIIGGTRAKLEQSRDAAVALLLDEKGSPTRASQLLQSRLDTVIQQALAVLGKSFDENNKEIEAKAKAVGEFEQSSGAQADFLAKVAKSEEEFTRQSNAIRDALAGQKAAALREFDANKANNELPAGERAQKRQAIVQDFNRKASEAEERLLKERQQLIESLVQMALATGGFTEALIDSSRKLQEIKISLDRRLDEIDATLAQAEGSGPGRLNFSATDTAALRRQRSDIELQNLRDLVPALRQDRNTQQTNLDAVRRLTSPQIDDLRSTFSNESLSPEVRLDALRKALALEEEQEQLRLRLIEVTRELSNTEGQLAATQEKGSASFSDFVNTAKTAFANFRDQVGVGKSLLTEFGDALPTILEQSSSSLSTFFKEAGTGAKSLGQAFKDLAASILSSLQDIFAKRAADRLIGLGTDIFDALFASGGSVRMAGGGAVPILAASGFSPTRDSVNIKARPGEFLLRNSAVDLIGRDTLEFLNAAGNRRVDKSRPRQADFASKRQPDLVNVWVVAPEERPQGIGPNDVIATIGRDILQSGQTKQLIKAVVRGAI